MDSQFLTNILGVASPTAGLPSPTSLLGLLFSFSALRDWLKLFVIGAFVEGCRRLAYAIYYKFIHHFYITAELHEDDGCYDWIMVWLSKQKTWAEARELQVSTRSFGLSDSAVLVPGEETDASDLLNGRRQLAYVPLYDTTHTLWYKGRWMRITRTQTQSGYYMRSEDKLTICIMTRHHSRLNELLLDAKKEYMAAKENNICIYVSNMHEWSQMACRPKRPLRSIILDPGIKDLLLDDAKDFLQSKAWYTARGIPFRRGYLLYGAPGSGKTSIIHSLAGELGLDVYIISLSRSGMDDSALSELISDLPEKCIALMEDIDAAFTQSLNRDSPTTTPSSEESDNPTQNFAPSTSSKVSLSGLLNALDGIGAQEGRILFATTNKYSSLDAALCRPGRMDIHIEFKLASKFQAGALYRCFYLAEEDETAPHGQENFDREDLNSESSSEMGDVDLIDLDTNGALETKKTGTLLEGKVGVSGHLYRNQHTHSKISQGRILKLANQFEDAVPEREFSMASLQGYLMGYKTRPIDAVRDVAAWIEKERFAKMVAADTPRSP